METDFSTGAFSEEQLTEIKNTLFSRILCDNLKNIVSVQRYSFQADSGYTYRMLCTGIPGINLKKWKSVRPPGMFSRIISLYINDKLIKQIIPLMILTQGSKSSNDCSEKRFSSKVS